MRVFVIGNSQLVQSIRRLTRCSFPLTKGTIANVKIMDASRVWDYETHREVNMSCRLAERESPTVGTLVTGTEVIGSW